MRPKVVASPQFLFYPVRRACSSAIQLALGYDFLDWDAIPQDDTRTRFTCYRNTFERLRSLYHNFVNPAAQGFQLFDLEDSFRDFIAYGEVRPVTPDFNSFILAVAATQDETCNEHLHSQDWHMIVPVLTVYDFENRQIIFDQVLNKPSPQLGPASPDLSYLKFSPPALREISKRYAQEIETFGYQP